MVVVEEGPLEVGQVADLEVGQVEGQGDGQGEVLVARGVAKVHAFQAIQVAWGTEEPLKKNTFAQSLLVCFWNEQLFITLYHFTELSWNQ